MSSRALCEGTEVGLECLFVKIVAGVVMYAGSEEDALSPCRIRQGLGSQPLDLVSFLNLSFFEFMGFM